MNSFCFAFVGFLLLQITSNAAEAHWKTIRINSTPAPSIMTIDLMPADPKQGDQVSALIQLTTSMSSGIPVNTLVTASLDSANAPLPLIHPSASAWIAQLGVFGQVSSHNLNVSLVIQDTSAANTLQTKITTDKINISKDNDAISNPANSAPATLAVLRAQLAADTSTLANDQAALAATLSTISTQTVPFTIASADPESSVYPHISQVSPNYGTAGSQITIEGSNFAGGTLKVLIGGLPASISSSSSSAIQVTVPAGLGTPSLSDVEVDVLPISGSMINAIESNSYYSVPANFSGMPIAVINPISTGVTGSAINLVGTNSTGGTGSLSYKWSLISVPSGSNATPPTNAAISAFTPDIGGTYIVGLQVTDSSGNVSQMSVDVINVTQPVSLAISGPNGPTSNLSLQTRAGGMIATQTIYVQNISDDLPATLTPVLTDAGASQLSTNIQLYQSDCSTGITPSFTVAPSQTQQICIQFTPPATNPNGQSPTQDAVTLSFENSAGVTLGTITLNTTLYQVFPLTLTQYFPGTGTLPGNSWTITNSDNPNPQHITIPAFFDQAQTVTVIVANTSPYPQTLNSSFVTDTNPLPTYPNSVSLTGQLNLPAGSGSSFVLNSGSSITLSLTATPQYSSQSEFNYLAQTNWDTGIDGGFQSIVYPGILLSRVSYPTPMDNPTFSVTAPVGQTYTTAVVPTPITGPPPFPNPLPASDQHGLIFPSNNFLIQVSSMTLQGGNSACFTLNGATQGNDWGVLSPSGASISSFTGASNFTVGYEFFEQGMFGPNTHNLLNVVATSLLSNCYFASNEVGNPTGISLLLAGYQKPIFLPFNWTTP